MRWPCLCIAAILLSAICPPQFSRAQNVTPPTPSDSVAVRTSPKKKNPTGAMLRSMAVPGWGQFYNGKYFKAVLALGAEAGLIAASIYWNQKANRANDREVRLFYQNNRNTANWWLLGTILFSMLDAYVDASLSDFDESPDLSLAPLPQLNNHPKGVRLTLKIGL